MTDKIEAISKASEMSSKQSGSEDLDHYQKQEHFQSLMGSSQVGSVSFERLDTRSMHVDDVQKKEVQPALGDDNVSSQKNGSATDQQNKKGSSQGGAEEIEGIGPARAKNSSSSSSTQESSMQTEKTTVASTTTSPENLKNQATQMASQIEALKSKLSQSNVSIKPSYQTLLRHRLSHIDDTVKIALNKTGIEQPSLETKAPSSGKSGVHQFLDLLTHSQHQMETLSSAIDFASTKGQLNPANLLALQMKMGYVQQQIELFTSLLNKALESTKTIMNVQV